MRFCLLDSFDVFRVFLFFGRVHWIDRAMHIHFTLLDPIHAVKTEPIGKTARGSTCYTFIAWLVNVWGNTFLRMPAGANKSRGPLAFHHTPLCSLL
jgi:hypothetical protein